MRNYVVEFLEEFMFFLNVESAFYYLQTARAARSRLTSEFTELVAAQSATNFAWR
jgi:hypothetical protein